LSYADKRVAHDRLVTLKERFDEGTKRWFKEHPDQKEDTEKEQTIEKLYIAIEKELFEIIGIEPDKLKEYI